MSDAVRIPKQVRFKNLIAYGFGELYGGGSFVVISMLFIFYLTDVVGMPPALAGLVVMLGKVWDGVSDPLMGYISDNMKTKYGRRRIFFLAGILPVAVTFFMLWVQVGTPSQTLAFLYYVAAYLLFSTVFTMVMIPYRALNAELTPDYKIRTRLTSTKMIFSQVSALLSATLPKIIVDKVYADDPAQGFLVMGIIFGIFYAVPWIVVYLGTWEAPSAERGETTSFFSFINNFKTLFISRSFRVQMGMYISVYSAMDILMAMFVYYLTYYIGKKEIFSLCMGSMILTSIAMVPLYTFIANKKGKGFAFIVGLCIWGAAMVLSLAMNGSTPIAFIVLLCVLIGIGMSSGVLMPWAMLPSIIDVDELITGTQRAGTCSGAMTLVRKMVQAVTLFLFGNLLALIGYTANTAQTASTLFWMKIMFFVLPGVLLLAGIIIAARFKITPATHAVLQAELGRLKEGGAGKDADTHTRSVCEQLTGVPYDRLYGGISK